MIIRDLKRLAVLIGPVIVLLLICVRLVGPSSSLPGSRRIGSLVELPQQVGIWIGGHTIPPWNPSTHTAVPYQTAPQQENGQSSLVDDLLDGINDDNESPQPPPPPPPPPPQQYPGPLPLSPPTPSIRLVGDNGAIIGFSPPSVINVGGKQHTEVFSVSTKDKKYFPIKFGSEKAINPNILPHPTKYNTYIIVAQKQGVQDVPNDIKKVVSEIVCNAVFINDVLSCIAGTEPTTLAIAPTAGDHSKCTDKLDVLALNVGPHDARVFYGPRTPYTMYGSNAMMNCFGQFLQDFRVLMGSGEWGMNVGWTRDNEYGYGTEIRRPLPYSTVEKNWFLFWDDENTHYVHTDIVPRRVFAQLTVDGTVGLDLGAFAAVAGDEKCLARFMPETTSDFDTAETIHQSTNSLAVTLCKRLDPGCRPNKSNTFVFTVFHHKTFSTSKFHAVYEPYVMVFRQRAPFEVYGVSTMPIWINGRATVMNGDTEMFYVVSIAWKAKGQKYHGYADDVVFMAFGIEDQKTAGIDVTAADLLANLGLCMDA